MDAGHRAVQVESACDADLMEYRYCPSCGAEYHADVSHCSDCGSELVDDPPAATEPVPWLERLNDRLILRGVFVVFLVAALIYALAGSFGAVLVTVGHLRQWESFRAAQPFQNVASAAFPVAIAALGGLVGAFLLRAYLSWADRSGTEEGQNGEGAHATGGRMGNLMRLLFALTVVFAIMWAVTGIATSREVAEFQTFANVPPFDEPEDRYVILAALHYSSYVAGVASLTIMGSLLILKAHQRLPGDN